MKRFLTSKDLFIFLFFLLISVSLWGLQAIRKTYETTIRIPVIYENMPMGMAQTEILPDKFEVTIIDRGRTLLNYHIGKRFSPISIDMEKYANQKGQIPSQTFTSDIHQQLNSGTQIIKIVPEYIQFNFVQLKNKLLPVRLNSTIELSQQYTFSDTIKVTPAQVEVFGPGYILDTLRFAYTEPLVLTGLKDTLRRMVPMKKIKDISYSVPEVEVLLKSELFTEKIVDVPVVPVNVPVNRVLRVFPSVVKVSLQLGLSLYDSVNAPGFMLTVDYADVEKNARLEKLPVRIDKQPHGVFNVRIVPKEVDYLIEIREVRQEEVND
jgi:hypothetical protein